MFWVEHPMFPTCRIAVLKRLKHFPATGLLSVSWLSLRERLTYTDLVSAALRSHWIPALCADFQVF